MARKKSYHDFLIFIQKVANAFTIVNQMTTKKSFFTFFIMVFKAPRKCMVLQIGESLKYTT